MEKSKLLEIDHYNIEDLHIAQNAAFRPDKHVAKPEVDVDFSLFIHKTELDTFAVSLVVKSREPIEEEHPYRFSMRIVGFFRASEPFANASIPPARAVNGLTMLYSLARGLLSTAASW